MEDCRDCRNSDGFCGGSCRGAAGFFGELTVWEKRFRLGLMAFHCTIVTPEAQALDEKVLQAIIPAHDGLVGILTDRAPLLVKLGVGPLRIDMAGGRQQFFLIDGGIAQMKDNNLTVLTTQATPASELDAQTAKAEFAEASARKATDPKSQEAREHQLERARAAQALAGKR